MDTVTSDRLVEDLHDSSNTINVGMDAYKVVRTNTGTGLCINKETKLLTAEKNLYVGGWNSDTNDLVTSFWIKHDYVHPSRTYVISYRFFPKPFILRK